MIERLLPAVVSAVATSGDDPGDDPTASLFPEEAELLGQAVEPRRAEFATARSCARRALRELGAPDGPLLRGSKREPLWPAGFVGSITHCTGYRAAAVARTTDILAIGIDAEPHEAVPAEVARRVLRAEERTWLTRAPDGIHWGRLIFSAKESVYKAWFPLARRWLGFDDAVIEIDPAAGRFQARLLVDPPAPLPSRLDGRFLVEDGLVLTAITVPV